MNGGNALNHGVQQPLFAPVSQQGAQLGDDIDLNDIFADYFINEFDDPLNAYTNSMANYSGAAAAVALAQKQQQVNQQQQQNYQQQNQQLTAGMVATPIASTPAAAAAAVATHAGALASAVALIPAPQLVPIPAPQLVPIPAPQVVPIPATQIAPTQAPRNALSLVAAAPILPTGGIKTMFHNSTAMVPSVATRALQQQFQRHQQQVAQPNNVTSSAGPPSAAVSVVGGITMAGSNGIMEPAIKKIKTAGGLSGRLGFSMVGGQLALPQHHLQKQQQLQQGVSITASSITQQSQMTTMASTKQQTTATPGDMVLPVGVGIRLGGIGGVAPATAAHRVGQYSMWSGGAGGGLGGPGGSGGPMSEQAIAERRQRNREHAKRSRVRKKFMLESLQEQVRGLQRENVELRMIIQEKIPEKAQKIISNCCCKNSLFSDPTDDPPPSGDVTTEDGGESVTKDPTALARSDFSLIESLTSGQQNFVLSDPRLPDNPIVYASPGFYVLTGYTQDQVLGRNCRFLQGPGTDPRAVDIIRKAIASGSDATTCILNYKSDGTPFWNQFFVAALRDADNCIVNYVGVQCEVETEAGSSALEDKVNSVLPLQNKDGIDTNTTTTNTSTPTINSVAS